MSSAYKPAGYTSVAPYLLVTGAAGTIAFLKQVFDAVEITRVDGPGGSVRHAEVKIDDSVIMLADAIPPDWPAVPAHVHVYVSDVDAVYERAIAAGATSVQKPVRKEDRDKRGGFADAGGTTWWIGTMVG